MQLFITNPNPIICAQVLDNKRVNNQTRETAQLLCTALHLNGVEADWLMKPTHKNNPITKWVSSSYEAYFWTLQHFLALGGEKRLRWPDNPPHKNWVELRHPLAVSAWRMPNKHWQPFPNCAARSSLGIDFTAVADTHRAYKSYLLARWSLENPVWTNRSEPAWRNGDVGLAA